MTKQAGVITGRIVDRPVDALFQSLHEERKTGVARFRTALGTATVWLRDGEIIDADMGRFHMEAAVLRLLKIQDGEYEIVLEPVNRRQVIRSGTSQLLAEGRKRAPRPGARRTEGLATGKPRPPRSPSGEYSHIGSGARDDSRPSNRRAERVSVPPDTQTPGRPSASRPGSAAETNVHTVVHAMPPTSAPTDTDVPTTVSSRSPAVEEAAGATRSPSRGRRRARVASWHPTAGGSGQADSPPPSTAHPAQPAAPTPPPTIAGPTPAVDPTDESLNMTPARGRTQFMFGIAGPAPPKPRPRTPSPAPVSAEAPAAEPGAPAAPQPRTHSESRRRKAQPRAQGPFQPEVVDKTLMRAGALLPSPDAPVSALPADSIPVEPTAVLNPGGQVKTLIATHEPKPPADDPTIPAGAPLIPDAAGVGTPPVLVNEEYSHPIAVATDPNLGPGGTMLLQSLQPPGPSASSGAVSSERPLPLDPSAEATVVINARDVAPPASMRRANSTAHVGRYEVLLRLARGGMGTVYLCRVTGEGGFRRLFALKVIRDHLNHNQAYVQMLLEEARIASRLNHPNIVSIIDIDIFASQHYLVMDYVEGCTFSELLKAHPKTRPPELVVPIVLDALTGLHAAHSTRGDDGSMQPVVHCDFSPQNMLVGVNGTCRITDFGIAKAANALPEGPGRGKPGYLSPEQVRGMPLDPRSDIFSAGVVLWNALTGEQLFAGDTPEQILHQVVSRKIPKPSTVGLRPPACFDRICLRALERDPQRRYQSAEQMLTELRKVAIAQDLLAPSSEVGRWVQDSFGAQIEMRRQAAGLAPSPTATALALRDVGPSGHVDGQPQDASATSHDGHANASQTAMLNSAVLERLDDEEGFAPRTRVVVLMAAFAFGIAAVLTLFVRPDLLQGGIIDENGQYVDLSELPSDDPPPLGSTGPAIAGAEDDSTTGTSGDEPSTGDDTEGGTDTDDAAPAVEDEPPPKEPEKRGKKRGNKKGKSGNDDKGKSKNDKGKSKNKPDSKKDKPDGKKNKPDAGDVPPPDLGEIFNGAGG